MRIVQNQKIFRTGIAAFFQSLYFFKRNGILVYFAWIGIFVLSCL